MIAEEKGGNPFGVCIEANTAFQAQCVGSDGGGETTLFY